jgi:non-lysosomal glucosylceramidase
MNESRRKFVEGALLGTASVLGSAAPEAKANQAASTAVGTHSLSFPRVFAGRNISMIAFPLGGVGTGSISLGGRGNLRDWEIFNRPDKGNSPSYALPAIWVRSGNEPPVARVLESRYQPPYEGQDGLGSKNAPGLPRLANATFSGQYPLAHIDFEDPALSVQVSLDAFTPFIPHEADASGLPVAILRYTVKNPTTHKTQVSIAWSLDNPVHTTKGNRTNELRESDLLSGFFMANPSLPETDAMYGSFALAVRNKGDGMLTSLKGWPAGRWWNSPLLFWDDFASDGKLGPETINPSAVGALCLSREIAAGAASTFEFLLAWHFPNRTPTRCGWSAPKGDEHTVIGNWYCTRFGNAWDAATYASQNLSNLEAKTRLFATAMRNSTLPPAVLEAASANLSTLATTTCFRTADGEFHGFEGVDDQLGCCFGNCTHVWNYETATSHLFPSLARSLRKSAFGFSMDDAGAMHFRQLLPDGKERSGFAAADGQMGQIVHAYLDWSLSADREWLAALWPRIRKAIEFAWVPGGWDANRDGVMEGVQHNTYDVEFYGPNPQCGIYYLAALRACEEMATALGEADFANQCGRLFRNGSQWIDEHLFNGEYYVQEVRPYRNDQIADSLRSNMGADDPEHPEYQLGKGCLVDQLVGQYLADVAGLGPLLNPAHIRTTLESIHKYNYKRSLATHECVERTFALNNESALVICDYAQAPRPQIPFPYFAEVMTGFEYTAATHMLFAGMLAEGTQCIASTRSRYDGERRNPWDEAECGHHYARAMAAWSGILALSGFLYKGSDQSLAVFPRTEQQNFRCIWATATGWGVFERTHAELRIRVHSGRLPLKNCTFAGKSSQTSALLGATIPQHKTIPMHGGTQVQFGAVVIVEPTRDLTFKL